MFVHEEEGDQPLWARLLVKWARKSGLKGKIKDRKKKQ
jgi:hypothetical protein